MQLGVEATRLIREQRGIGRYVRNLVREMVRARPSLALTFFVANVRDGAALLEQLGELDPALAARSTTALIATLPESRLEAIWYPWGRLQPRARYAATVTTICDVAPMLRFDHRWWKVLKRMKYRRRFRTAIDHSDVVLTISAFSAREMARLFQVPVSRFRVTLLAADDRPPGDGAAPAAPGRVPASVRDHVTVPYFIAVGASEARKNLSLLFRAMAQLNARGTAAALVLCGPGAALETAGARVRAPWLHYAGYVSDSELSALYRDAVALVFPSRYEGFGLPPLEAMVAGGCVICTNASALPEVVGDAALMVDWKDVDGLAAHMQRLLDDPALGASLRAASIEQAARFSWARTARETLDGFDDAVRAAEARRSA